MFLFLDNKDEYKLGTGSIKMPVQSRSSSKNIVFFEKNKKINKLIFDLNKNLNIFLKRSKQITRQPIDFLAKTSLTQRKFL